jgi:hypothetical protein
MMSYFSSLRLWTSFLAVLCTVIVPEVRSEIIELDIVVDASSDEVHFVRGYLKAPASIDLSKVAFLTTKEPDFAYGDDEYNGLDGGDDTVDNNDNTPDDSQEGTDDDAYTDAPVPSDPPTVQERTPPPTAGAPPTDPPTAAPETREPVPDDGGDTGGDNAVETPVPAPQDDNSGGGDDTGDVTEVPAPADDTTGGANNDGGAATEAPAPTDAAVVPPTDAPSEGGGDGGGRRRHRILDDGTAKQVMDLVLFMVPEDCKKDSWGTCDWAKLGVGAYDDEMEGGMSYCCSADTAQRGLCNSDDIGTLMVDRSVFSGDHRKVVVPQSTDQTFVMDDPRFDITVSGDYVLVIANCNDFGLEVLALGNMEWQSVNGYLPGDMIGLMFFYGILTAIYVALALWYYCGMKIFQDAAIPIQKYILATIIIGLLEVLFRTTDFVLWNYEGMRSDGIMYTAMSLGVLKRASSRCLGVMVAMGWGVVRDSLGNSLVKIIVLGVLYAGLTLARDFFIVVADDVKTISMSTQYFELMDFAWILTILVIFINVIFYFWIISSLNATTEYLRNMNQTSKLKRHLTLRCLIIISLIVVGIWYVLEIGIIRFE